MRKKSLIVFGILVAFLVLSSCSSNPEKTLLSRYFNAVSMNDNATMASMALEPAQWDLGSWQIVSVSAEKIEPLILGDLNKKEIEAKKTLEQNGPKVVDIHDQLVAAQDDLDLSRTAAAKAGNKKKVDELQAQYDESFKTHKNLQKAYYDAKAAAATEEQATLFSLGLRELLSVRDLTGNVHSKDVVVKVTTKQGQAKTYRLPMRMYEVKSETGQRLPSRWVITRFEPVA